MAEPGKRLRCRPGVEPISWTPVSLLSRQGLPEYLEGNNRTQPAVAMKWSKRIAQARQLPGLGSFVLASALTRGHRIVGSATR
jgi:hypothetical protein